jgi:hypothetical protein
MNENANQSIELVANKLDSYIAILAEKLGVAAEYVYPLFVKQQAIEAWWFFGILGGFALILSVCLYKSIKYGIREEWDGGSFAPTLIFGFLFAFCVILPFGVFGIDYFTKIVNPEYAAIQAIIQSVK